MNCDLTKLDAYIDDSSTQDEINALQDHLRICTSCNAEAFARLRMKRATQTAATRFVPSPEFRKRVEASIQKKQPGPRRSIHWVPIWSAFVAAVLLVAAFTFVRPYRMSTRSGLSELLDMHIATLASSNPVDVVSTDRHSVKPWFQGKLPFTFNLPELDGSSFKLLGGKLIYFEHAPGAQVLFELRKHELSVFIVKDDKRIGDVVTVENGFNEESFVQSGLRYVVIGDTSPSDVHALSDLFRSSVRQ